MPIVKVPVEHKFGIISQGHKQELQKRLVEQAKQEEQNETTQLVTRRKSVLEATGEFVIEFNDALMAGSSLDKLLIEAHRLLEHAKRSAGRTGDYKAPHVDLTIAWTELMQLYLCKSEKFQEECSLVLHTSLNHAPLLFDHIPALFYIVEMVFFWISTEIQTGEEIKPQNLSVLRTGALACCRLFYYNMAGFLNDETQLKTRIQPYIDTASLSECYADHPVANFHFYYMIEVAKTLTAGLKPAKRARPQAASQGQHKSRTVSRHIPSPDYILQSRGSTRSGGTHPSNKGGSTRELSSAMHDLSPSIWHSLDIWQHYKRGTHLRAVLTGLLSCSHQLGSESWVDACCGMDIMAQVSASSLDALQCLQHIACGKHTSASTTSGIFSWDWELVIKYVTLLADIVISTRYSGIRKMAFLGHHASTKTLCSQYRGDSLHSTGLADMLYLYDKSPDKCDEQANDDTRFMWKVRTAAVLSIHRVYKALKPQTKAFSSAVWNVLEQAKASEKDVRVIRAIRASEVEFAPALVESTTHETTLASHMADELSRLYLHSAAHANEPYFQQKGLQYSPKVTFSRQSKVTDDNTAAERPLRTSLRQEIALTKIGEPKPMHYTDRLTLNLRRIVEDQWRKEEHQRLSEEQDARDTQAVNAQPEATKVDEEIGL